MTRPMNRPWACPVHSGKDPDGIRCRFFEIGLGRSATRSVYRAVHMLGLRAMHGTGGCQFCLEDALEKTITGRCDYELYEVYEYVGHMASGHWRQLAEARPDAKFILPVRPKRNWIRSIRRKYRGTQDRPDPRRVNLLKMKLFHGFGPLKSTLLREGYDRYLREIRECFEGTDRLLEIDVFTMNDDELWNKLSAFVGKPCPRRHPFPRKTTPIKKYRLKNKPEDE